MTHTQASAISQSAGTRVNSYSFSTPSSSNSCHPQWMPHSAEQISSPCQTLGPQGISAILQVLCFGLLFAVRSIRREILPLKCLAPLIWSQNLGTL